MFENIEKYFKQIVVVILALQFLWIAYATYLYSRTVTCTAYGCYERVSDIGD